MQLDLKEMLDKILADYARVEPSPDAIRRWAAPPAAAPDRRLWASVPVWSAIAAVLLLALALAWVRGHGVRPVPQPKLATERLKVVLPNPKTAPPLTDEQKQLIELLAKDPSAFSKLTPDQIDHLLQQKQGAKHP